MLGFGKGEVGSSILLGSTIFPLFYGTMISLFRWLSPIEEGAFKMQNNNQTQKPDQNRQDKMDPNKKNPEKQGGSCGC